MDLTFTPTDATSARAFTSGKDGRELLQEIVSVVTKQPEYSLHIKGLHNSGDTMVTDFDFNYGIGAHLVHGVTYVTVPPSSTETELDLGLLTGYVQRGEGHKEIPAGIELLVKLARSKSFVKESSGCVSFSLCVDSIS